MTNVLHEIPFDEWQDVFEVISETLKPSGKLLFIEQLQLSTGERPNRHGFLVLGVTQIKELFKIKEVDTAFDFNFADDAETLLACFIPSECLKRIDETSRKDALMSLEKLSLEKMENLQNKKDYRSGRQYAFWTQQFANISLALKKKSNPIRVT